MCSADNTICLTKDAISLKGDEIIFTKIYIRNMIGKTETFNIDVSEGT